jgi:hypothetical protein
MIDPNGGISATLALVNLLGSMAISNSELMSVMITSDYGSLVYQTMSLGVLCPALPVK